MKFTLLFYFEAALVFVNIFFWLRPLLKSIKNGIFNTLHPQFITPLWIVYFIINAVVQNWYPWMGETEHGILRTTNSAILTNPYYLIMPLIIIALCAPCYHFGVRLFCNSITNSSSDKMQILRFSQVVPRAQKVIFIIFSFFISGLVWLPNYFIPNADFGTFWTYPLAMTNAVLPFMIFCVSKPIGILSFIFLIASALVMRSKASFLYPVMLIAFYYLFRLKFNTLKAKVALFVFMFLAIMALSLGFGSDARRLIRRDYAFESFAALVNQSPNLYFGSAEYLLSGITHGPYASWMLEEIKMGIPSFFYPQKKYSVSPSKMVSRHFLPFDYKRLPDAYFNRFFIFAGYYDLGIIGAFINALFFGALYGWLWKKTKKKVVSSGYLWPLFLYLPVPAIATYFVACGGYAYGFINALVPSGVIFIILIISKWFTGNMLRIKRLNNIS
jgi:hypothetical protein